MKKILLITLMFSALGANAQQKLIGINSNQYDETGSLTGVDSSEYVYNSWGGSIYSNEPQFVFDGSVLDWSYDLPSIKWDVENIYSGYVLINTKNNTFTGWNATVSESASDKDEFTYDAAGNLTNEKRYYFNGSTFDLAFEDSYEYDANNNKIVHEYTYHSGGTSVVESIDSFFYSASNDLTHAIEYNWDGTNSVFYASTESFIAYSGTEVTGITLYQGDETTPLTWAFDIDYTYAAGQPTNIVGYQVVGGVPATQPFVEIDFAYGANNKLSLYQLFLDGDLMNETAYSYDGLNFVSEIIFNEFDFGSSTMFVANELKFYYQNTVGVEEVELAEATIFPNPSSDFVTISADSEVEEVAVYNSNGLIVLSQKGGNLEISNLPAGVYIAKVKTATGVAQARFVKQ